MLLEWFIQRLWGKLLRTDSVWCRCRLLLVIFARTGCQRQWGWIYFEGAVKIKKIWMSHWSGRATEGVENELVVSDQLFLVILVAYNKFKIQRILWLGGINVTSEYFFLTNSHFTRGPSINDVSSKREGGRDGGGQKCWNLHSKKTTKGEGGHKIKCINAIYGWPQSYFVFWKKPLWTRKPNSVVKKCLPHQCDKITSQNEKV